MKIKQRTFRTNGAAFIYTLTVLLFMFWSLAPIIWSFIISITPRSETMVSPARFFPLNPTFDNYVQLLDKSTKGMGANFKSSMLNTVVAGFGTILLGLPISYFGAYAIARMEFKGRKIIESALYSTLVIPVLATIIPLYRMFTKSHLINTQFGLIIVYISSLLPLIQSVITSYLSVLPKELEEAAAIDGCSRMRAIFSIILPLSYPVLLSSALIMFINVWNQYLIPQILTSSDRSKPIAVVISEFVTKNSSNYGLMNAGGILAIIVPCVIAVIFRKFLASGLTAGSTKG